MQVISNPGGQQQNAILDLDDMNSDDENMFAQPAQEEEKKEDGSSNLIK